MDKILKRRYLGKDHADKTRMMAQTGLKLWKTTRASRIAANYGSIYIKIE